MKLKGGRGVAWSRSLAAFRDRETSRPRNRGTTPLNYRLTPGVHELELTRARYGSWVRELTVTEGLPTRVTALLEAPTSEKPCPTAP